MFWGLFSWEWGQAKQQVGYQEGNWLEMRKYVQDLEVKVQRLEQEVNDLRSGCKTYRIDTKG